MCITISLESQLQSILCVAQETMKMMGVSGYLHWSAWFIKYLVFMLITIVIMTIMFCVDTPQGRVITFADPTVIFVFLLVYVLATIAFCFAISTFFTKGKKLELLLVEHVSFNSVRCHRTLQSPNLISQSRQATDEHNGSTTAKQVHYTGSSPRSQFLYLQIRND